jgi:hypothetical protein
MEIKQGDFIAGRILREELAQVISHTLHSPSVSYKTFEVRRDESSSGRLNDGMTGYVNNFVHVYGDIDARDGLQTDLEAQCSRMQMDQMRATGASYGFADGRIEYPASRALPPYPNCAQDDTLV